MNTLLKTWRFTTVAAAGILSVTLLVSGCGGQSSSGADPQPTTTAGSDPASERGDARTALAAAIDKAQQDSAHAMFMMVTSDGVKTKIDIDFDPARQLVSLHSFSEHQGRTMYLLLVEQDLYLRLSNGPFADAWLRTQQAKIPADSPIRAMAEGDLVGADDLMTAVTSAQWSKDDEITGTVDLTSWSPTALPELDAFGGLSGPGDALRAVPLQARLDNEGRLIDLNFGDQQLIPQLPSTMLRYGRFGQPVTILPPTDAVPMPEAMEAVITGAIVS